MASTEQLDPSPLPTQAALSLLRLTNELRLQHDSEAVAACFCAELCRLLPSPATCAVAFLPSERFTASRAAQLSVEDFKKNGFVSGGGAARRVTTLAEGDDADEPPSQVAAVPLVEPPKPGDAAAAAAAASTTGAMPPAARLLGVLLVDCGHAERHPLAAEHRQLLVAFAPQLSALLAGCRWRATVVQRIQAVPQEMGLSLSREEVARFAPADEQRPPPPRVDAAAAAAAATPATPAAPAAAPAPEAPSCAPTAAATLPPSPPSPDEMAAREEAGLIAALRAAVERARVQLRATRICVYVRDEGGGGSLLDTLSLQSDLEPRAALGAAADHPHRLRVSDEHAVAYVARTGKASMLKVRSWRGHGCPPEASLTASEGLGLPSALVKRGPASQMPSRGRGLPARGRPSRRFRRV